MEARTVVITQSNYIPWKGYFDLIDQADVTVLLDDVQFTRRDWRNRNRIKHRGGLQWLSIPIQVKGRFDQTIREAVVSDASWAQRHWAGIRHAYKPAPFYEDIASWLEPLYLECDETHLSQINRRFLDAICAVLGIRTEFRWSWDFEPEENPSRRLLSICEALAATEYLSGPAAKSYLDLELFERAGVAVRWMDYSGYSEYQQLWGEFEHGVSVVDLLFNVGPEAPSYLRSTRPR